MTKEYKTQHWGGNSWYYHYLVWEGPETFPKSQEDPKAQFVIRSLKTTVLSGLPTPSRIENESVIMRTPYKDGPLEFNGSIGWKAQLFWEGE